MNRLSAVSAGTALVAIVMGLAQAFGLPLNHDAAWILHVSREMLDGQRLYGDIIEVNPPLVFWLNMPVILLERATGISHVVLFPALVAIGGLVSLLASYRMSRHVLSAEYRPAFLVALAIAFFVVPATMMWGQREHILLLLTTPYVIGCAARVRGVDPGNAWLIAVPAAVGFALKPHFVPGFIALEAWALLSRRHLWRSAAIIVSLGALYLAGVVVFTNYLPMAWAMRDVYSAYLPMPLSRILVDSRTVIAAAAILFVIVPGEGRELRTALGISTLTWLLALVTQGKGFEYHYVPAVGAAVMLITVGAIGLAARRQFAGLALTVPVMILFIMVADMDPPGQHSRWPMIREAQAMIGGSPALLTSPFVRDVWPHMSYADAHWQAPVPSGWASITTPRGEELAAEWFTAGLRKGVPVLVPLNPWRNVLGVLLRDGEFSAEWAQYSPSQRGEYYYLFTRQLP